MTAEILTREQQEALRSHVAHDLSLLARPDWLALDARREPAVRKRLEQTLDRLRLAK